ncbi:MAG TPA: 2-oxoacid:ferredoxin oxidoreductase subunit beta [Thermoanaerobaculia bacterium]|nr:2-oxoacid:ferredoxin oxidoreductase subunit beta [Thermoanaerobaculia bacterium]HUM29282.1 2-oxoacid:ferredoxin oxidoreductase subunit beta [Thermoanaerobaculia bacterium]HXK67760.1 2-oxoacid:ferredoxin oxidoreductase subunit beta [Thermoanaerobaculia bacterium]
MSENEHLWSDYKSGLDPIWCPGCGDFGVLNALYHTLAEIGVDSKDVALISGIGCSSRIPGYIKTYGFNSIHGRLLPIAQGTKLANPALTVIGTGGDGDGLAIGAGHFPHACRRNVDITYIMMDNGIYGLTKGQTSPTSPLHLKTKSSYYGNPEHPFDPAVLAISYRATFVARAFAGNVKLLKDLMKKAIEHRGFSFIQVLSPCVTYRGRELFKLYKEITYEVDESFDPTNKVEAFSVASREDRIALGILYREDRLVLSDAYDYVIAEAQKDGAMTEDDLRRIFLPLQDDKEE